jgi:hypothetical protein
VVGKTRRWLASEPIHELVTIDKKIKIANQELTELVASTGSRLQELHGIGPSTEGRRYYRRKLAAGKTSMEAMRALKRRLSDIVYRQMAADAKRLRTGPGGHLGATLTSSAADPNPKIDTSDKSLPDPPDSNVEHRFRPRLDREGCHES